MVSTTKVPPGQWRTAVPLGMRSLPRWLGHRAKKPLDLRTGGPAAVDNPATWATFEEAAKFYADTYSEPDVGVGFAFKEGDGLVFIDLDHIFADQGQQLTAEGEALLEELNAALGGISKDTYCEVSPSGTGLHVFGIGRLGKNCRHVLRRGGAAVEVYDRARYSTVTGRRYGPADQLAPVQERVNALSTMLGKTDDIPQEAAEPGRAEEIAEALSHLDPDMPYAEWLKVGMSLKAGLGEAGREMWLMWSKQGAKAKEGEPEEKWASFRRSGIGLGSVLYMAREAGWDSGASRIPSAEEDFAEFATESANEPMDGRPRTKRLDRVKPEKVDWLWKGRLALGHVALVAGDPGRGKSTMTLDVAAKLTKGLPLPGETWKPGDKNARPPGRALYFSAEDGQADTIRPRAEAANADLTRITVLDLVSGGRLPQLPDDVGWLDEAIDAAERDGDGGKVLYVVLDPLNAFLPVKLDSFKDQHMRQALAPLEALAQRRHLVVVLVVHLNKAENMSALYRVAGSVGLAAAARFVLLVGPDAEDEGRRIVAPAKQNIGQGQKSLAFTIRPSAKDPDIGVVEWLGESDAGAEDLVRKPEHDGEERVQRCMDWLRTRLEAGPLPAAQVQAEAQLSGFGRNCLREAKRRLGVTNEKPAFGAPYVCSLPEFHEMAATIPPASPAEPGGMEGIR